MNAVWALSFKGEAFRRGIQGRIAIKKNADNAF